MKTRWQLHVESWSDCHRCELRSGARHVVLARGAIPADVVFVGEAPGTSEDVNALPFVGPAGKLLDQIVAKAVPSDVRCAFTNLVGCFPREAKETEDHRPPDESIVACAPRVVDFIAMCRPKLVVAVGKLSEAWLDRRHKASIKLTEPAPPMFAIMHPAAILRANPSARGLLFQRACVTLGNAVTDAMAGRFVPLTHVPASGLPKREKIRVPAIRTGSGVTTGEPQPREARKASTFQVGAIGAPPSRCSTCRKPLPPGVKCAACASAPPSEEPVPMWDRDDSPF